MSLTSLIKTNALFRSKITELFPKPPFVKEKDRLWHKPLPGSSPSTIGTAYDYLLRIYLMWKYHNNSSLTFNLEQKPIASRASAIINYHGQLMTTNGQKQAGIVLTELSELVAHKYQESKTRIDQIIHNKDWNIGFNTYEDILLWANLDTVYRAGYLEHLFDNKWRANINVLVAELKDLGQSCLKFPLVPTKRLLLNVNFPKIPALIDNADADLIIDEWLIDIKTTKDLKFTTDMWRQLVGYYVLAHINDLNVTKVGIYYARYQYLFEIKDLDKYITVPKIEEFMSWMNLQS